MACLEADIVHLESKLANSNDTGNYQLLLEKKTQLRESIQEESSCIVTQTKG